MKQLLSFIFAAFFLQSALAQGGTDIQLYEGTYKLQEVEQESQLLRASDLVFSANLKKATIHIDQTPYRLVLMNGKYVLIDANNRFKAMKDSDQFKVGHQQFEIRNLRELIRIDELGRSQLVANASISKEEDIYSLRIQQQVEVPDLALALFYYDQLKSLDKAVTYFRGEYKFNERRRTPKYIRSADLTLEVNLKDKTIRIGEDRYRLVNNGRKRLMLDDQEQFQAMMAGSTILVGDKKYKVLNRQLVELGDRVLKVGEAVVDHGSNGYSMRIGQQEEMPTIALALFYYYQLKYLAPNHTPNAYDGAFSSNFGCNCN